MFLLRAVLNILVKNASPKQKDLCVLNIYYLLCQDLVMLYPCMFCVSLLMDLFVYYVLRV